MAPGQDGVGKMASRSKKMKTYTGWIKTDDNQFFLQVADEVGFYVCDYENSWRVPPFASWKAVKAGSVPKKRREEIGWLLAELKPR
jgi:hypothetical protein